MKKGKKKFFQQLINDILRVRQADVTLNPVEKRQGMEMSTRCHTFDRLSVTILYTGTQIFTSDVIGRGKKKFFQQSVNNILPVRQADVTLNPVEKRQGMEMSTRCHTFDRLSVTILHTGTQIFTSDVIGSLPCLPAGGSNHGSGSHREHGSTCQTNAGLLTVTTPQYFLQSNIQVFKKASAL